MRELLLDFYTNLGKRKLDQSKYIGTFDFKKGSTPKMDLKSWNAGLLMEKLGLVLAHKKLKRSRRKESLRVDDVTKSPPPLYNEFAVINCLVVLLFKKWEKFVNLMSKYYLNG